MIGQALYMAGDLEGALRYLERASGEGDSLALYYAGRILLLTGDFRTSKEYFERAFDACVQAEDESLPCWRAAAGIGDALYGSGRYEEAKRRYRYAGLDAGDAEGSELEIKVALCEMALGDEEAALARIRTALPESGLLRGWVGNELGFLRFLKMQGIEKGPELARHAFLLVGPLTGSREALLDAVAGIPVKRTKSDGRDYLEIGPFPDPVEAMIHMEKIRQAGYQPEMVMR